MNPSPDRKHPQQQESEQKMGGHEFASVEELLRYDAERVAPPASIATRLQDSIAGGLKLKRSWWRRLFSK